MTHKYACMCACVCMCVCVCVRACVRASVRASVSVCGYCYCKPICALCRCARLGRSIYILLLLLLLLSKNVYRILSQEIIKLLAGFSLPNPTLRAEMKTSKMLSAASVSSTNANSAAEDMSLLVKSWQVAS